MTSRTFSSTLWRPEGAGSTCFFPIPFEVKAAFGKARPPVKVSVNGHTYQSTVSVYGKDSFVVANLKVREAAGLEPGKKAKLTLTLDTAPRIVKPPKELARALRGRPLAQAGWKACSFSHQREFADAVEKAKRPETRARRIEQTLMALEAIAAKAKKKPTRAPRARPLT
jgi:hypothetical protein